MKNNSKNKLKFLVEQSSDEWKKVTKDDYEKYQKLGCEVKTEKTKFTDYYYKPSSCPSTDNKIKPEVKNLPEWAKDISSCLKQSSNVIWGSGDVVIGEWGRGTSDYRRITFSQDGTLTMEFTTGDKYTGYWVCYGGYLKMGTCEDNEVIYYAESDKGFHTDKEGWLKKKGCKKESTSSEEAISKYDKNCSTNDWFKKGCEDSKIGELQKALGISLQDNKWGDDLQKTMEEKFPQYKNGLNKSQIDDIVSGRAKPSGSSNSGLPYSDLDKEKEKKKRKYKIEYIEDGKMIKENDENVKGSPYKITPELFWQKAQEYGCVPDFLKRVKKSKITLEEDVLSESGSVVLYQGEQQQALVGQYYDENGTTEYALFMNYWMVNLNTYKAKRWYCSDLVKYENSVVKNALFDKFGVEGNLEESELIDSLNAITIELNKLISRGAVSKDFVQWDKIIKKYSTKYKNLTQITIPSGKSISLPDAKTLSSYYYKVEDIKDNFPTWNNVEVYLPKGQSTLPSSSVDRGENEDDCKKYLIVYLKNAILNASNVEPKPISNLQDYKSQVYKCGKLGLYKNLKLTRQEVLGNLGIEASPFGRKYGEEMDWSEIKRFLKGEYDSKPYNGQTLKLPNSYSVNLDESKLKGKIKSSLNEMVLDKKKNVIQENVIKGRTELLFENVEFKSRKERREFVVKLVKEALQLESQGFDKKIVNENFWGVLKSFFGEEGSESVFTSFKTRMGEWLTSHMSPKKSDGWIGDCIRKTIKDIPMRDVEKITDCDFLTREITKSVIEKLDEKMDNDELKDNGLYDIVRTGMKDNVKSEKFKDHIEQKISEMICPILNDMSNRFDSNFENMKKRIMDF